jgi:hypothetical protein
MFSEVATEGVRELDGVGDCSLFHRIPSDLSERLQPGRVHWSFL